MDEKVLEWLSDKFGDELKKKIPSSAFIGAVLAVLIFWAGDVGIYKSALLGLVHLTPADLTDEEVGLGQLPIFLFLVSSGGALACYALLKLIAKRYFRFVCGLKPYRSQLESMVNDHKNQTNTQSIHLLHDLRAAQLELEKRRVPIRQWIQGYYWLTLIGLVMVIGVCKGNALDLAVGIVCLIGGIWSLFKSVGVFLATVTPWHAKVNALTELITGDTGNPMQIP